MSARRVAGRYTLRRAVGQGATGSVWLGHDEVLDRAVALKRTGTTVASGTEALRAEREGRLGAQLTHPHVVSVFDLVTDEDATWLVMEYVDGPPLSKVVREAGPMSPDEAARWMAPIADALAHAHAHGIVHRDVKPSNILAAGDGGAKLSDFGIARSADDATLTRTGLVTGSPAYLAPEVARGEHATPASDVWSVGATLVHLLTGRPPYHRDDLDNSPLAVLVRIVNEDPPVVAEADWLAPLLARTMTHDPEQRPTMAEVFDFLYRPHTDAQQTMAMPSVSADGGAAAAGLPGEGPRRHWPAPRVLAAVAAAVLAIVLVTALALQDNEEGGAPARADQSASTTPASGREAPTAAELKAFAADYVRTADADPDAGFAMLTRAYQEKSPGYADFWGPMSKPEILAISADPKAMTVTYTYRYHFPRSGTRTETVTLRLVDRDGQLLIDGEA